VSGGIPATIPSRLEEIMSDPDYANAVAYLVVSVPDAKPLEMYCKQEYVNPIVDKTSAFFKKYAK